MNVHLQWTTGSDYEIHQFSTLLDRLRYLYSFMHVLFTDFPNFDKKKKLNTYICSIIFFHGRTLIQERKEGARNEGAVFQVNTPALRPLVTRQIWTNI